MQETPQEALEGFIARNFNNDWTTRQVASLLSEVSGHTVSHGLVSKVLSGLESPRMRHALGMPPAKVEVEPCNDCGELHAFLKTCPKDKKRIDRRKSRAWKGNADMTALLDSVLEGMGYRNLQEYVDTEILEVSEW